jgi:hypothetical protein
MYLKDKEAKAGSQGRRKQGCEPQQSVDNSLFALGTVRPGSGLCTFSCSHGRNNSTLAATGSLRTLLAHLRIGFRPASVLVRTQPEKNFLLNLDNSKKKKKYH